MLFSCLFNFIYRFFIYLFIFIYFIFKWTFQISSGRTSHLGILNSLPVSQVAVLTLAVTLDQKLIDAYPKHPKQLNSSSIGLCVFCCHILFAQKNKNNTGLYQDWLHVHQAIRWVRYDCRIMWSVNLLFFGFQHVPKIWDFHNLSSFDHLINHQPGSVLLQHIPKHIATRCNRSQWWWLVQLLEARSSSQVLLEGQDAINMLQPLFSIVDSYVLLWVETLWNHQSPMSYVHSWCSNQQCSFIFLLIAVPKCNPKIRTVYSQWLQLMRSCTWRRAR